MSDQADQSGQAGQSDQSGAYDAERFESEPFSEVMEPQEDTGLHHDRRDHGGMPERLGDDALERLVEEDRVAAGLADYAPDDVPPATDDPPEGTSERVTEAERGLLGDTEADPDRA